MKLELSAVNALISPDEIEMRNHLHKKIDELRLELQDLNEDWKNKLSEQVDAFL